MDYIEYKNYLMHYGVEGQKWGTRRWQNEDGSLTPEGRRHYGYNEKILDKASKKLYNEKRVKAIQKATEAGKERKLVKMARNDIDSLTSSNNFIRKAATAGAKLGVNAVAAKTTGIRNFSGLVPTEQITLKADIAIGEEIARNYLKDYYSDTTIAAALKKVNKGQKAQAITSDVVAGIGAINLGIGLATGGKENIITAPIKLANKISTKNTMRKNDKMFKERESQNAEGYDTPDYKEAGSNMSDYGDEYDYGRQRDTSNSYDLTEYKKKQ